MVNRGAIKNMGLNKMNRKAMFFTVSAIILLSLLLISLTFYSAVQDKNAINKRVDTLNNFIFSTDKDIQRKLYISGFRVIFLFEKRIVEEGSYISDLHGTFQEAFFNGTIYSESQELMNGAMFSDIVQAINEKAGKINADVELSNPNVAISQDDPWEVKITLTGNMQIYDPPNAIFFNRTLNISGIVPVMGFEDPIYLLSTNGKISNKINKSVYSNFVSGNDVSNLSLHSQNSYYIASIMAPSFLDRLEGNFSANPNGIESLVYLPELSAQGIAVNEKSNVDYIYFSSNNPTSYHIKFMPAWFRIDNDHLNIYQVSGLTE